MAARPTAGISLIEPKRRLRRREQSMRIIGKLAGPAMITAASLLLTPAQAGGLVGNPAPTFNLGDSDAHTVALADYKGRTVVLEWTNDGCPFVQHYYQRGAMQALQQQYTAKGVVWLTIISSAPGKQGYVSGARADELTRSRGAHPTAVLFDPTGKVGHLYSAATTPDMVVIDPAGTVAYSGAIDSIPSTDPDDIARATPYLKNAVDAVLAGQPVGTPATVSYGCTVKY